MTNHLFLKQKIENATEALVTVKIDKWRALDWDLSGFKGERFVINSGSLSATEKNSVLICGPLMTS